MSTSSESLAERFARDKGAPQEVGEDTVHAIYQRDVAPGTRIEIALVAGKADPVQGLRLKLRDGELQVEDVLANDVLIWTDTMPPTAVVTVVRTKEALGQLRVWNIWRGTHGSIDAWLGDAGMVVAESAGVVELQCSDGRSSFTKTDLVARLRFQDADD